jgi:hypothetical protein
MIGSVFLNRPKQSIQMQFFNLNAGDSCMLSGIGATN